MPRLKRSIIKTPGLLTYSLLLGLAPAAMADNHQPLTSTDVFNLEYVSSPDITSDGDTVYFVRQQMDKFKDSKTGNIWKVSSDGDDLLPVTTGEHYDWSPVLSPDETRLAFISNRSGSAQIYIKWLKTSELVKISSLTSSPSGLTWAPDGKSLVFSMFVPVAPKRPVSLAGKPKGASWADDAIFIEDTIYRFDGSGYRKPGNTQLFTLAADGGHARQLTDGPYNHGGTLSFTPDGNKLYFSASRFDDAEYQPLNSEIYRLDMTSKTVEAVTDRNGPDSQPRVSPNGKWLAYTGHDDKGTNYENQQLYLKSLKSGEVKSLTADLDRSVSTFLWDGDSDALYISYEDQGKTRLDKVSVKGKRTEVTDMIGGTSLGRPYTSGDFDISDNGKMAFTLSDTQRPAELAVTSVSGRKAGKYEVLTDFNADFTHGKDMAKVEEFWVKSSYDGLNVQGWIMYPPGFDKSEKYPLLLEIHGGPTAAYGPQFSMELQLFAARGYVVLYMNPRGSSSYGKEFAQTIMHNYPSQDYDDLMSGVDEVIKRGFIDEEKLYVTGGSGGGTLTTWIVGKTDRFAAAVVAKPVMNWYSFVLTADYYPFFTQYWFPGMPWDNTEHYMKRSPISLAGNITTPTMLLTGEDDYRTPIAESEQLYQALKLQKVDTAMVRIPGASHGITARPSNLMAKVEYILWWFEQYGGPAKP